MGLQHFFIDGKYHGAVERKPYFGRHGLTPPYGIAIVCPICCELWAKCPLEGEPVSVYTRACRKHPKDFKYGSWNFGNTAYEELNGSVWLPYEEDFCNNLPDSVLAREVLLWWDLKHKGEHNALSDKV